MIAEGRRIRKGYVDTQLKSKALVCLNKVGVCIVLNIAETPETSDYTSIKQRIKKHSKDESETRLFLFIGNENAKK